jgi:hypothetical protein
MITNKTKKKRFEIINNLGLSQIISECTHFTENSDTILDLIIVNKLAIVEFSGVGDNALQYTLPMSSILYIEIS